MSWRMIKIAITTWLVLAAILFVAAQVWDPDFDIRDDLRGKPHGVTTKHQMAEKAGRILAHGWRRYGWGPFAGMAILAVGFAIVVDRTWPKKQSEPS